ncbi:FKBP12-associated protein [Friedmanniomyces endolithicus]|uniref:FKBP12-associated protein n=1 Tax=Friedmanniomyces endolithicus TaxID=329885 RepID=A0AAN6FXV4_9PEZI|nr:FKBP12-associated protein [Friedmanniomyces endolithicus]KAK0294647.1 FKBP12-associated protein [Friedmanniomyces endolithicus]KAK0325970.1 FKBP12-associated protein [Friedmanniomyces endolithicus]KAK1009746.1 FKBP12-associated protein [Friedmanniomyces endolithicus]
MKCNASKSSEGNNGKTLPCNEECARLERNRRLALALNIDQSSHQDGGDHIPYSTETLNLFAQHVKWSQTQEREFRVFATSDDEKRLRFKPMKARERAFVHALAEDFGLDSESMDPEPHRHVMVWKTPRFVSAPNKTLAEALRIRTGIASATASANVSDTEGAAKRVKASNEVGEPYNAFVISHPRFGLTVDELRTEIAKLQSSGLAFDVEFLPSDEVMLKASSKTLSAQVIHQTLRSLKPALVTAITSRGFGSAQLCTADTSSNILRRESDAPSGDGWSRVAAKKAAPKFLTPNAGFGGTNSFAALQGGNKVTFAKKKPEKVKVKAKAAIVDDWEAAEQAAEQAEEEREGVKSGEEDGGAVVGTGTVDEAAGLPASAVVPALASEDEENDVRPGEETTFDGDESATKGEESAMKGEESAATGEKSATTADERTALHTEHETQPAKALSWAEEVEQAL